MTKKKRERKEGTPQALEHKAYYRNVRVTPRKCRLVVDMIRGRTLDEAIEIARRDAHRGAYFVHKLLLSAMAGAQEKNFPAKLMVSTARVDDGPSMKRFMPRARGHADPILKRSCHITVGVKALERKS